MKHFLKTYLIPGWLLRVARPYWHGMMSMLGALWYGRPSDKLIVIGVTGTNGKTTTVNLIAKALQGAGYQVGFTSTAVLNIDGIEDLNTYKMTMPSGWLLQKWLRRMVERGCQYAVLEVSSEGLAQNRHKGINFDLAVFTNLTPEHIESHGGFENYKASKGRLFAALSEHKVTSAGKIINPKLKKTIITNSDSEHAKYFASFKADTYLTFGVNGPADYRATDIGYSPAGISFTVKNLKYQLLLKGRFDVYNALAAIAVADSQNIPQETVRRALENVEVVPGRVEVIQSHPFAVVVDYAYEPEEMKQLYETVECWPHQRIIQVLGPTGGGRDQARIPVLGEMAARFADLVIVTTDDPYDEDPKELAQKMEAGILKLGKVMGKDALEILDRRAAIAKAINAAGDGDLVLITGKGADQKMALAGGKYVDWDDRQVAREALGYLKMNEGKKLERNWFA